MAICCLTRASRTKTWAVALLFHDHTPAGTGPASKTLARDFTFFETEPVRGDYAVKVTIAHSESGGTRILAQEARCQWTAEGSDVETYPETTSIRGSAYTGIECDPPLSQEALGHLVLYDIYHHY
jgi:hypothetical protein